MAFLPQISDNNVVLSILNIMNEKEDELINSLDRYEGESEMAWLNRHYEALNNLSMAFNNIQPTTPMSHRSHESNGPQMTHVSQMTQVSHVSYVSPMMPILLPSDVMSISPLTPMSPVTDKTYIIDGDASLKSSHDLSLTLPPPPPPTPMSNISSEHECDIPDDLEGSFEQDYYDRHNRNLNRLF